MKDLITSEDHAFVLKVAEKYMKLGTDELLKLINIIRGDLEYAAGVKNSLKPLRQKDISEFEEKLSPGTKIQNIVINTNKGPLTMYNYDEILKNFVITAKRVFQKYKTYSKSDFKLLHHLEIQRPFLSIERFTSNTTLGPFQKRVVIGMFLVYFRLWIDKPIMTETEYFKNPTSAISYLHYLSDIAEAYQKKYSGDFSI